jgi:hypothetical protein
MTKTILSREKGIRERRRGEDNREKVEEFGTGETMSFHILFFYSKN